MKTAIARMVKFKITIGAKNNSKPNNAFSTLVHAATALILLIGNSSFTSTSNGQGMDHGKLENKMILSLGDEISKVKIATPSKHIIKMGDIEMHKNMNNLIKEMNSFRIGPFTNQSADDMVSDQFYAQFSIACDVNGYPLNDQMVSDRFYAEHINMMIEVNLLSADYQMFINFYFNEYINVDPALATEGDKMISDCFYRENEYPL